MPDNPYVPVIPPILNDGNRYAPCTRAKHEMRATLKKGQLLCEIKGSINEPPCPRAFKLINNPREWFIILETPMDLIDISGDYGIEFHVQGEFIPLIYIKNGWGDD